MVADHVSPHERAVAELGPIWARVELSQPLKALSRDDRLMTAAWLRERAVDLESDDLARRGPDLRAWYFHG